MRRFFRHGLLPQLFVFEAVSRLGSVTRAAEELHLAQPTVSIQMKKLAAALEVTLFERQGRQLRLTAAGEALREACGDLIHCVMSAEARLEPFRKLVLGSVPGIEGVAQAVAEQVERENQ
jgi:DNA-binding transcriptional LysR family regulator